MDKPQPQPPPTTDHCQRAIASKTLSKDYAALTLTTAAELAPHAAARVAAAIADRDGPWLRLPTPALVATIAIGSRQRGVERAIVRCERWALARPSAWRLYRQLGDLWQQVGRISLAQPCWLQATRCQPHAMGSHDLHQRMDWVERVASRPDWQQPPLRSSALALPADFASTLERVERQLLWLDRPEPSATDRSRFWLALASHWVSQGLWLAAEAAMTRAIFADPTCPDPPIFLGALYRRAERWRDAARCYDRAIADAPPDQFAYYKPLATLPELLPGQLETVLERLRPVIETGRSSPMVRQVVETVELRLGLSPQTIARNRQETAAFVAKQRPQFAADHWDDAAPRWPQFVILGAQKSGTTSLYRYLHQHPQVLPIQGKEIQYFYPIYEAFQTWAAADPALSMDWYMSHFPPVPPGSDWVTGEASPEYLPCPQAPARFAAQLPHTKAIAILRDPVARFVSHYYHRVRGMREFRSLAQSVAAQLAIAAAHSSPLAFMDRSWDSYLARGLYAYQIDRWQRAIGRDRLLLLTTEQLAREPQQSMDIVCHFLGLQSHRFDFEQRYNVGQSGPPSSDNTNTKPRDREPSADEVTQLQKLRDFYRPHNQELADRFGVAINDWSS